MISVDSTSPWHRPKLEGLEMAFTATKTQCPVSRPEFLAHAKDMPLDALKVDGKSPVLEVNEFSTGSLGWYYNGKVTVMLNGKPVKVQCGMNLTIVGSKELPQ
jgi:hypothetical protein